MNYKEIAITLESCIVGEDFYTSDYARLITDILFNLNGMSNEDARRFILALIAFVNASERERQKTFDVFCCGYGDAVIDKSEQNGEYDSYSLDDKNIIPNGIYVDIIVNAVIERFPNWKTCIDDEFKLCFCNDVYSKQVLSHIEFLLTSSKFVPFDEWKRMIEVSGKEDE